MALANYTDLQAGVTNWLQRSDLASRIPEFIALAESKLNRELKTLAMETKNATFSITGEYVTVPTDFIEVRSFELSTNPRRALKFASPDAETMAYYSSGCPRYYSVVGSNFRFSPTPDATYSSVLTYYAKIPAMASNSTNWLLTAHPDVYLYGSLLEAEAFLRDDPRLQIWKAGYSEAVDKINGQSSRGRWGGASMSTRPERVA